MKERVFELFNEHEMIEPVTAETLTKAFEGLDQGKSHILILEATPLIEKSPFIQVAWEKGIYVVEIQFKDGKQFQQFRKKTEDVRECHELFQSYLSGKLPELSGWQDVTAEIIYYYDDEEEGVAKKTSHPFFVHHFTHELYYDIIDDYAPFGNDTGNDSLRMIEDHLAKEEDVEDFDSLPVYVANSWKIEYLDPMKMTDDPDLISKNEQMIFESCQLTIAVGFGVIKITGGIDSPLKERTICALAQMSTLLPDGKEAYQLQIDDLKKFQAYDE